MQKNAEFLRSLWRTDTDHPQNVILTFGYQVEVDEVDWLDYAWRAFFSFGPTRVFSSRLTTASVKIRSHSVV